MLKTLLPRRHGEKTRKINASHNLSSFWEMLRLNSERFLHLMGNLHVLEGVMLPNSAITGEINLQIDEHMRKEAKETTKLLRELDLPMCVMEAERFEEFLSVQAVDSLHGKERIRTLTTRVSDELKSRHMLVLSPMEAFRFEDMQPFGQEVWAAFPSSTDDAIESSKCMALGRYTACVMHCSRIAECGLKGLAEKLSIANKNDWGSYLLAIEKELDRRVKDAGSRTTDEQFYAEAAANFDRMRRAWRNPSMHSGTSYSLESAEEIFGSVKAFMKHLSLKIAEPNSMARLSA